MTQEPTQRDVQLIVLVSRYATPFAVLLVLLGLFLASPSRTTQLWSMALMVFGFGFNLFAVWAIKRNPRTAGALKTARMLVNLGVNLLLVYLLGPFWPPMWLLLALTPIATAIYEGPKQTLLASLGASAAILGIQLLHGGTSPLQWGQVAAYAAFIVLMCLLINELTQASYPHHPQDRG